jgi:CheY-like chemotaxis protein
VLRKQFSSLGIEASFAMAADDAVIYFEQQAFDIVLSDYHMPAVSGSELLEILREIEHKEGRPRATKLILTADKTQSCYESCIKAGADQVIYKPPTLSQLSIIFSDKGLIHSPEKIKKDAEEKTNLDEIEEDAFFFSESLDTKEKAKTVPDKFTPTSIYSFLGDISDEEAFSFLSEYSKNLKDIRIEMAEFTQNKQWKNLTAAAHSLKSSALIVGAKELSLLCENLEKLGFDGESGKRLKNAWAEVDSSTKQLIYLLQTELNNNES